MSASLRPQDPLGSEEDGQDFFTREIGTLQCVLSNSLPKKHSHSEEDRIILNHPQQSLPFYRKSHYHYGHYAQYPSAVSKYPTRTIKYREKTIAEEEKVDTPTPAVKDQQQKQMQEEQQRKPPSSPQRVQQTSLLQTNLKSPPPPSEIETDQSQNELLELLNTAYIDNSGQNELEPLCKPSLVLLASLLQEEETAELASLNIDLNPKKTSLRAKKQFLQVSQESERERSKLLDFSNPSVNQSLSEHSINLNLLIQQHTRKYNTIALLQQCPKREIVLELQTNSYTQSVTIRTVTVLPLSLPLRLSQCTHSDILTPLQSSYAFPSRLYLEQLKTITLCTMHIPDPQSTPPHEYCELVASHMLKIDACSLACVCGAKNKVSIRENWNGEQSCKRCSNRLRVTLRSMTVRV